MYQFDAHWAITSVHSMPVLSEALEVYDRDTADSLTPNPFRINIMTKQSHGLQHGDDFQGIPQAIMPVFCNNSSALIYSDGQRLALPNGLDNNYLNISFLTKNDGSYCIARMKSKG